MARLQRSHGALHHPVWRLHLPRARCSRRGAPGSRGPEVVSQSVEVAAGSSAGPICHLGLVDGRTACGAEGRTSVAGQLPDMRKQAHLCAVRVEALELRNGQPASCWMPDAISCASPVRRTFEFTMPHLSAHRGCLRRLSGRVPLLSEARSTERASLCASGSGG